MGHDKILEGHLREVLKLQESCIDFLMKVWRAIQVFDDVADGDSVKRPDLDFVIWDFFIGFYDNEFFKTNFAMLRSQLATMIIKWQASDKAERSGKADEKSYMWRAGFYDVVLMCFMLQHGHEAATNCSMDLMNLYGETFDDYKKEFGICQTQ